MKRFFSGVFLLAVFAVSGFFVVNAPVASAESVSADEAGVGDGYSRADEISISGDSDYMSADGYEALGIEKLLADLNSDNDTVRDDAREALLRIIAMREGGYGNISDGEDSVGVIEYGVKFLKELYESDGDEIDIDELLIMYFVEASDFFSIDLSGRMCEEVDKVCIFGGGFGCDKYEEMGIVKVVSDRSGKVVKIVGGDDIAVARLKFYFSDDYKDLENWILNIGDSPMNDGWGGSLDDSANAEFQIYDTVMALFANTNDDSLLPRKGEDSIIFTKGVDKKSIAGSILAVEIYGGGFKALLSSDDSEVVLVDEGGAIFEFLSGSPDENDLYVAINRSIAGTLKGGGVERLEIELLDSSGEDLYVRSCRENVNVDADSGGELSEYGGGMREENEIPDGAVADSENADVETPIAEKKELPVYYCAVVVDGDNMNEEYCSDNFELFYTSDRSSAFVYGANVDGLHGRDLVFEFELEDMSRLNQWVFTVADSPRNNGWGGDNISGNYDSELQLYGTNLSLFGNDFYMRDFSGKSRLIKSSDIASVGDVSFIRVVLSGDGVDMYLADKNRIILDKVSVKRNNLFDLSGVFNSYIYFSGGTTVYESFNRKGSGLKKVISWVQ